MNPVVREPDPPLDAAAVRAELDAIAAGGDAASARTALLARMRAISNDGRAAAEQRLLADGKGTACARYLSDLEDGIITALHDYAGRHGVPGGADEAMAVVAVGGYGRSTLAPGSDIDLLFVLPARQTARAKKVVEFVLYVLWDMGFKVGHATRSVSECITEARTDITTRTAILEARLICGDEKLFGDLKARFDKEIVAGTAADFVAAKLTERDERHQKQGVSRYLVEPNVKEGKGGQRDLNTLFWIAKYVYRTDSPDALVKAGVFSQAELRRFLKAEDFLWAVRCNLHFMTGRAEERLSFDHQQGMAARLGYTDRPGLSPAERFMKHYFLTAKDVGDLTRIFSAALEEQAVKPAPGAGRFLARKKKAEPIAGAPGFVVDRGRINVADGEVFARDPANLIRIFSLSERLGLAIHPDATQLVTRQLRLVDAKLRADPEANRLFLDVLVAPRAPEPTLRLMNETGVLGRFVPDFGKIVAMMQFSMYHHYTVDEHLLRAVGVLSALERGELKEEHPLVAEILPSIKDRIVLYVAVFLHDIAKGRVEDHSIAGARVARRLCPRLGLDAAQTETVVWLIEQHLTMSMMAQQRDLQDHKTILDFAAIVQSMERLKLLLVLTVVDIRAVGPGVWNGWKGQLLRTLYWETEPLLTGGHSQVSRDRRVAAAREELKEALTDWPEAERQRHVDRLYPAYLLRVDLAHKVAHAALLREVDRVDRRLATEIRLLPFEAVTEITIIAADHPRLLSIIAGACAVAGGNIVDAQIFTTTDGLAVDTVFVNREFAADEDETRRALRIKTVIEEALEGRIRLPESVRSRGQAKSRYKPFSVPPSVVIDHSWSNKYSAVEVSGLDRPGLLYDLTRALSDLNLNIGSAHIATFGERAVDVFYVTDLIGHKVNSPTREATIVRRLTDVLAGTVEVKAKRGAA